MRKFFSQRIKILLVLLLALISMIMIKSIDNKELANIKQQRTDDSVIKIKYGSKLYENKKVNKNTSNKSSIDGRNDVETVTIHNKQVVYEEKKEDNLISKVKDNLFSLFNINKDIVIDTKDTAIPNNVEKVEIKVLEDNAIINLSEPKDNGTDYEYIVENEGKKETLKFHSETGIYGYSYKINNDKESFVDEQANKLDNSPIIIQNIDWDKDYYLHIRTIDKNNNISENNTIKIDLPSFGIKVEYIDKETGKYLSTPEKITGIIHDSYDAKNKIKEFQNYTLVSTIGEVEGLFNRELKTISFQYAQNKNISIKYIDEETGIELAKEDEISGYIGKELYLNPKIIESYIPIDDKKKITMEKNIDEVIFKYKKLEDKIAKIVDNNIKENTNEANNEVEIKEKVLRIRYVDINTDKILFEDKIITNNERQIRYKLKEIEGYSLVNNINDNSDENQYKNEPTIMDEIINSLDIDDNIKKDNDKGLTEEEKRRVIAQYEIVMNCDESDYIIYYKK